MASNLQTANNKLQTISPSVSVGCELKNIFLRACKLIADGELTGKRNLYWNERRLSLSWAVLDGNCIISARIAGTTYISTGTRKAAELSGPLDWTPSTSSMLVEFARPFTKILDLSQLDYSGIVESTVFEVVQTIEPTLAEKALPLRTAFIRAAILWTKGKTRGFLTFDYFGCDSRIAWGPTKGADGFTTFWISINKTVLPDHVWMASRVAMGRLVAKVTHKPGTYSFDVFFTLDDSDVPAITTKGVTTADCEADIATYERLASEIQKMNQEFIKNAKKAREATA